MKKCTHKHYSFLLNNQYTARRDNKRKNLKSGWVKMLRKYKQGRKVEIQYFHRLAYELLLRKEKRKCYLDNYVNACQ